MSTSIPAKERNQLKLKPKQHIISAFKGLSNFCTSAAATHIMPQETVTTDEEKGRSRDFQKWNNGWKKIEEGRPDSTIVNAMEICQYLIPSPPIELADCDGQFCELF